MSVARVSSEPDAVNKAAKPPRFWRKLAQALDEYFVDRTQRAVPEITLRRCKHEVDRYRRLMLKRAMAPAQVKTGRVTRAAPLRRPR